MKKIFSLDAETDGLWGKPFAIAAIVYDGEKEVDKFVARLPNEVVTNKWVIDNVLPTLDSMLITHESYENMLSDFALFYMKHKDATALWHMGHVVESFLFREMVRLGLIGEFDAPYTPIEVSAYLKQAGENPASVDEYVKRHGLDISDYGSTHNPLYDCEVAARVFFHIQNN